MFKTNFCLVSDNFPNKDQQAEEAGEQAKLSFARNIFLHGVAENLAGFDLLHWSGEVPKQSGQIPVWVCVTKDLSLQCIDADMRPDGSGYVTLNGDHKAGLQAYLKMRSPEKPL